MKKNQHAVELGRLGGRIGGFARAAKLSAERRQEIARQAALARWAKWREDNETNQSKEAGHRVERSGR